MSKQDPNYNFDKIILKKPNKLLFIYYSKNIIINNLEQNLEQNSMFDILFINYTNPLDNNKIISWLNNDFSYIVIIIDILLKQKEINNLFTYCRFIKNPNDIVILYNNKYSKLRNMLLSSDIKFNKKFFIKYQMSPYDQYIIKYDDILFVPDNNNNNNKLSESWFYKYIKNKFYSCATGRLRQISGTCYANAVMNCILLSKSIRALFFIKLKKDLEKNKNKDLLKDISKKMDEDCPAKNKIFIYRFLYNLLCSDYKPTMKSYYKDILMDPDNIMTRVTKRIVNSVNNRGYYSQLFSNNLFIDVFKKYYKTEYYRYKTELQTDNRKEYFPYYSVLNHPYNKNEESLIVIYDVGFNVENKQDREIPYIKHYRPIACVLYVEEPEIDYYHLVCGYICNGVPMIYDSDSNYIGEHNWLDYYEMKNLHVNIDKKYKWNFKGYPCVYYIKKSFIEELENTKLCP